MTATSHILFLLLALQLASQCHAFVPPDVTMRNMNHRLGTVTTFRHAQRYGPTSQNGNYDDDLDAFDRIRSHNDGEFRQLLRQVMEMMTSSMDSQDKIPSLLGQNIQLLVSIQRDQIETILSEAYESGGEDEQQRVVDTLEYVLGFAETFVDTLKVVDDGNKQLLGKIIRAATTATTATSQDPEEALDHLLELERENLTPGFLRHLEGECERIANAPKTTPESLRLLQILRTIQVRVVEELGKELGDEALVLGQLLGYDDAQERIAVLKAGMGVRGLEFSRKMAQMTGKALDDFQRLGSATDPELVERITQIHETIQDYLGQQ